MAEATKLAPERAYLGETMPITLSISVLCAGIPWPFHIALVMDGSGSMAGAKSRDMKSGAREFVREMGLDELSDLSMGVVEFATRARTTCPLTRDESRVLNGIQRVGTSGEKEIGVGIDAGLKLLTRGRREYPWGLDEAMLVFSDGQTDDSCRDGMRAANSAKNDGVLVVAICVGADCDERCMRSLASSSRWFYRVEQMEQVAQALGWLRNDVRDLFIKDLTVTERLPANMRYVPGSVQPLPTMLSADGRELRFYTQHLPKDGVTFTLGVEPQGLGLHPANEEAKAEYETSFGWKGTAVFPVPQVLIERRPTATATVTSTATRTATITPLATVMTPAPTPTPRRWLLHLPNVEA